MSNDHVRYSGDGRMTRRLAWTYLFTPRGARVAALDRSERGLARAAARSAVGLVAAAVAGTVLMPATAGAQVRGYVSFNGGTQATASGFADNVLFTEFHEDADFDTAYAVGTGMVFDGGAGVRLGSGLGFGVAMSRFKRLDPASIDARIPHPFFFDRPRSLTGSEADLARQETTLHVEVRWSEAVGDAIELTVFGGPSLFNVRQDLVTAIGYDHAYPYNEASLASATTTAASASAIGFHVGADVGFFVSEVVGLGALIRYAGGSVGLQGEGGGMMPVDAGGLHVGGGLRLRF